MTSFKDLRKSVAYLVTAVPEMKEAFRFSAIIGNGTFSTVFLARHIATDKGNMMAVKHIIPTCLPWRIENELRCLQALGGKDNIVEMKACVRRREHVVIIMPYFPHDKFMDYVNSLTEEEVRDYMKNLLIALRRVHSHGLIHRDIKPANFLYNRKQRRYTLVDFGLAQKVSSKIKIETGQMTETPRPPLRIHAQSESVRHCLQRGKSNKASGAVTSDSRENINTPQFPIKPDQSANTVHTSIRPSVPAEMPSPDLLAPSILPKPMLKSAQIRCCVSSDLKGRRKRSISHPQDGDRSALAPITHQLNVEDSPSKRTRLALSRQKFAVPAVALQEGRSQDQDERRCHCYGLPQVCSVCLHRENQVTPRAGTPGFRAPEVLLKHETQTSAVDMWAAGVIFLCLLAGHYPFFQAPDDMTGLAEIIATFGSKKIKAVARKYDKVLTCSVTSEPLDLRCVCVKLRSSRPLSLCGENLIITPCRKSQQECVCAPHKGNRKENPSDSHSQGSCVCSANCREGKEDPSAGGHCQREECKGSAGKCEKKEDLACGRFHQEIRTCSMGRSEKENPITPDCRHCHQGECVCSTATCEGKRDPPNSNCGNLHQKACVCSVGRPKTESFPVTAYHLLSRLLDVDSTSRITATEALQHPFITEI